MFPLRDEIKGEHQNAVPSFLSCYFYQHRKLLQRKLLELLISQSHIDYVLQSLIIHFLIQAFMFILYPSFISSLKPELFEFGLCLV